jgi:glucokinase-like ROK family protein
VNFETNIDDDQLVEKIFRHSKKLIRENQIDEKKIFAVGLTMPGLVDEKAGINYTIKNKRFQNVKERLEKKFKILVYINNDARMQAYGEFIFGKAKEYKNAIIVSWSWGIGMGMILNGKLFNGATGFAGEFSHIKIEKEGDLCICGKKGCLETVASANVLLNRAKSEIEKGTVSQLTVKFKDRPEELGPTDVIEAAKAGDEFSISLLNKIGLALGQGLSIAIQLLNPDIIVIGGPVSAANQFILIPIQQSLHRYCLEQIYRNTKIEISERGEESGLLGVTAILFQQLFKVE